MKVLTMLVAVAMAAATQKNQTAPVKPVAVKAVVNTETCFSCLDRSLTSHVCFSELTQAVTCCKANSTSIDCYDVK